VARFIKLTAAGRLARQVIVNLDLISTLDGEPEIGTKLHFNGLAESVKVKEAPEKILELIAEEIAKNPLNR
jgi:hypothetical protein